ncbi:MAG: hypothetical protein VKS61_06610 [Candidatus Sericytochromatia bacterium]|nr:hypothetical protein [Candidatus Sericytochromatia bacterium]
MELEGALGGPQLQRALATWNHHRREGYKPFGQVLLDLKMLNLNLLQHYSKLQLRLMVAPSRGKPLGILALETRAVRPAVLLKLLERQGHARQRIGEMMLAANLINHAQLELLLRTQQLYATRQAL